MLSATGILAVHPALAGIPAAEEAGSQALATISDTAPVGAAKLSWQPIVDNDSRLSALWAHSPSMNRDVPLFVISPKDTSVPRPIVYVLNGGDGGESTANWVYQSDIIDFYRDKNVWAVIPMAGQFSYYTDWVDPSEYLGGKQMWETFLTKELPGPLEKKLGASSKRGLIGMSMSATTTLLYAEHHPGFYDAIGSFSGCAETSRGFPLEYLRLTLDRGHATPEQMWGPIGGKTFLYNDALLNAARLKGQKLYISNGTGLPGKYDLWNTKYTGNGNPTSMFTHIVQGGVIEAATNKCTHDLKAKLDKEGIPVNWNLRPVGTHSWGYWQQDLVDSWPMFARAFNMDPGKPHPVEDLTPISPEVVADILGASQGKIDPRQPQPVTLSPVDGGTDPSQPSRPRTQANDNEKVEANPAANTAAHQPEANTETNRPVAHEAAAPAPAQPQQSVPATKPAAQPAKPATTAPVANHPAPAQPAPRPAVAPERISVPSIDGIAAPKPHP